MATAPNTPSTAMAGLRQTWANPKSRKGMIVFAAMGGVILVGTFFALNSSSNKVAGPAASAAIVAPPSGNDDVTATTQESYKELVREVDKERAEKALADSNTAMILPRVTGMSDPDQFRLEEEQRLAVERGQARARNQSTPAAQPNANQQGGQQVAPIDPDDETRATREYILSAGLLQRVSTQPNTQEGFSLLMAPVDTTKGMAVAEGSDGQAASAFGSNVNIPKGKPFIRAGEITYANLDIALNSDYSGPVIATIREGKFNGARIIGQKSLENEAVVVTFTSLSPADGSESFPISAYAVSLGDAKQFGLTGLEGESDYHVFQRYIIPGAIAFVQAFGMSASQKGTVAVVSENGGGVGTTTPPLTKDDRYEVALGNAMTPISNDISRFSGRPITVSLQAGAEIGIMFAADTYTPSQMREYEARGGSNSKNPTMGVPLGSGGGFPGNNKDANSGNRNSEIARLTQEAAQANARSNAVSAAAFQQYQSQMSGVSVGGGFGQPSYGNNGNYSTQPSYGNNGNYSTQPSYGNNGNYSTQPSYGNNGNYSTVR